MQAEAARRGRKIVGGFYLSMGGVHLGIVAADPQTYRHFADASFLGFVRTGWSEVFMVNPAAWGFALFLGETLLGLCLLAGGRWVRAGWVGVIAFHVGLMLFGFGIWLWSVPALALLVTLARVDWPQTTAPAPRGPVGPLPAYGEG